jgi:hypothetical protein
VDRDKNNLINEAYKQKYSNSPYLPLMISHCSRAATVRIMPKIENKKE